MKTEAETEVTRPQTEAPRAAASRQPPAGARGPAATPTPGAVPAFGSARPARRSPLVQRLGSPHSGTRLPSPHGQLAAHRAGAWVTRAILSAPQEACDSVAEPVPTQGDLLLTSPPGVRHQLFTKSISEGAPNTGVGAFCYSPPPPLRTCVRSVPDTDEPLGRAGSRAPRGSSSRAGAPGQAAPRL